MHALLAVNEHVYVFKDCPYRIIIYVCIQFACGSVAMQRAGRAGLFTSVAAVTPGPLVENARACSAAHPVTYSHTHTHILHNDLAREVCAGSTALTHRGVNMINGIEQGCNFTMRTKGVLRKLNLCRWCDRMRLCVRNIVNVSKVISHRNVRERWEKSALVFMYIRIGQ